MRCRRRSLIRELCLLLAADAKFYHRRQVFMFKLCGLVRGKTITGSAQTRDRRKTRTWKKEMEQHLIISPFIVSVTAGRTAPSIKSLRGASRTVVACVGPSHPPQSRKYAKWLLSYENFCYMRRQTVKRQPLCSINGACATSPKEDHPKYCIGDRRQ